MAHHNHDDHCSHEAHDHDHDHDDADTGPNDNLYMHIDRDNVVALNGEGDGRGVIKPWHERANEEKVTSALHSPPLITTCSCSVLGI